MEDTQTILERSLTRQFDEMQTQPFLQMLLSVAYSGKILDEYMKQSHDLTKKQQYYQLFEFLYTQLGYKANDATDNKYFLQKGMGKAVMSEITSIIEKYAGLKQRQIPISLILQTNNPTLNLQQVKIHLKYADKFYQQCRITQALRSVQMAEQVISNNAHIRQKIESNLHKKINDIKEDFNKLLEFKLYFSDQGNWHNLNQDEEESTKCFYKLYQNRHESQSNIVLKMETQLEVDLFGLLIALLQPQALQKYAPFVQRCQNFMNYQPHASLPINKRVWRSHAIIPYLVQHCDVDFYLMFHDQLSTSQSLFIIGQSLSQDKRFCEMHQIPYKSQRQKITLYYFCLDLKPITKQRVLFRLLIRPHFKKERFDFPTIKRAARIFNSHYFINLCKLIKENRKFIEELQQNNDQFYRLLQKRVDQYWKQKEA